MQTTRHMAAILVLAIVGTASAAPIDVTPSWATKLLARDLDGNAANGPEAYYDTVQNLTWISDWSSRTHVGFAAAQSWADGLTLGGYADWRLPTIVLSPGCQAYNCRNSEVGRLWYELLGNVAPGAETQGPFRNMSSGPYWLAPQATTTRAWVFDTGSGFQSLATSSQSYMAVAVRSGDTQPVPEPGTATALLAGLGLLAVLRRSRRRS